jgi:hypothetical protein
MAKIAEFDAKDLKLTPSNTGYSAAEQAARRIGPFATQAAGAIRKVADLQATEERELGQQQTAFARLQGLEAKAEGSTAGVKIGGRSLKDMFQLGAGGNEPNYGRLNELSNGAARLSRLARDTVRSQSPVVNEQLQANRQMRNNYQVDTGKTGIEPNPDVSDKDAAAAGFNMGSAFDAPDRNKSDIGFSASFNLPGSDQIGPVPAIEHATIGDTHEQPGQAGAAQYDPYSNIGSPTSDTLPPGLNATQWPTSQAGEVVGIPPAPTQPPPVVYPGMSDIVDNF